MSYSPETFERAKEIITARRLAAENSAQQRRSEFEKIEPKYKDLKNEMILSVREVVKAIDMKPSLAAEFIDKQKLRNLNAQNEIKMLLKKHSLPENYLEVKYTCKKCDDTGIDGNRLCSCQLEVLKKLAFDAAGNKSPLKFSSFDDFKLSYYSQDNDSVFGCSPRERMTGIFNMCKAYAADFDTSSQSLLMYGETGLGKTHLSLSIAGEAIKKGYNVLYNSAQNIFNELQKERFGKTESSGKFEALVLESDLLVIDDLGAEFSTQFTNAALYNIINTRINCSLPTIISTNLDLKGIEERYTNRICSRIIGEYAALNFFGSDIRQLKND